MGKAKKAAKSFIDGIPDSKLENIPNGMGTLYKTKDFRLDMQGITTEKPKCWNLQVQVNNETSVSTLKKETGKTVSTVLVPMDSKWTAAQIKEKLHKSLNL
ncbi:hypothetical protein F5B18DRAFT_638021 [Nemania serpens]|nr:hypothetical protein F5B18DRAFT_638021 [Nemania serpens]